MDMMMWSRWGRVTVAGGGLTLLCLGVLPLACTGGDFESCTEGKDCGDGTQGGGAGADGNGTTSTGGTGGTGGAGGANGVTSAGGAGGSQSDGGSGGGAAAGGAAAGGAAGTQVSGSGGNASTSSSGGGEAGEDGLGEGGAGETGSCEDSCEGTCCDGVCVDLESSLDHCGACGSACTLDHAEEACVAGSCVVTECWDESVDCNGDPRDGCEVELLGVPEAPHLTRPMLGAFTGSLHARDETGSLRPEFVWTEVEPVTCSAVTYQLQVDDTCPYTSFAGCAFPSPKIDVSGLRSASFVSEANLPVEEDDAPVGRRYYWRVRACETPAVCSEWSEVFYVDVGRVREDVTGDGYPDVVGATADGELFIARGSDDFFEQGAAEVVPTTQTPLDVEAMQLSFLGDVNGDGFNDLGGVGLLPSLEDAALYVWLGAEAFGGLPGVLVGSGLFGAAIRSGVWPAGDVDRDGYGDLMLRRTTQESQIRGWLTLKSGGSVLGESPDDEVPLTDTRLSGTLPMLDRAATSGDFNGDGVPDLVSDGRDGLQHAVQFMLGGGSELSVTRTVTFAAAEEVEALCNPMMATLDFNGDDIDDVAVLCRTTGVIAVVFGARDLADEDSPVEFWTTTLDEPALDLAVGDADNSGFDDVFVSGPMAFWGAADPEAEADGFTSTSGAEDPIAFGDHDADGSIDLMRANRWYPGLVTPGSGNVELTTEDGDDLDVMVLAH